MLAGHGERMLTCGQLPVEGGESYSVTISSPLACNMELNRHAGGQQTASLQEERMRQEDEQIRSGKWLRQEVALGQKEAKKQYL